jgi:hypothetical protein
MKDAPEQKRRVVKEQLYELEWYEQRGGVEMWTGTAMPKGSGPDKNRFRVLAACAQDALSCVPSHAADVRLRLVCDAMSIVVAREITIAQEPS